MHPQSIAPSAPLPSGRCTGIELKTYTALKAMHLQYEPQKRIGRWTADAYVPYYNAVVECLGDYFHCNPAVYPSGPINDMQRYAVEKDQRRYAELTAAGYLVIALWERAINTQGAQRLLELALLGQSDQALPPVLPTGWARMPATAATAPVIDTEILIAANPMAGEVLARELHRGDAPGLQIATALNDVHCGCKRGLFKWQQRGRTLEITVRCPRKTCGHMPTVTIELEPF